MIIESRPHTDNELFSLLLDFREFAHLWSRARSGEATREEQRSLSNTARKLADELEVLPFRGRALSFLLEKRPRLLPGKLTRIPAATDTVLSMILEYLTYRCDDVIWEEICSEPKRIDDYLRENRERINGAKGLLFEIIVRKWLRKAGGRSWRHAQQLVILSHGKHEFDAVSFEKHDTVYGISAAEIKWKLEIEDAIGKKGEFRKFAKKLKHLACHVEGKSQASFFDRIALVTGNVIPQYLKRHFQDLIHERYNVDREHVEFYDLNEMEKKVKNASDRLGDVISHTAEVFLRESTGRKDNRSIVGLTDPVRIRRNESFSRRR